MMASNPIDQLVNKYEKLTYLKGGDPVPALLEFMYWNAALSSRIWFHSESFRPRML
jgi:hypothetical protein